MITTIIAISQREAEENTHIDLVIFSILIKINVTAIILVKNIAMFINFGIPEHHQTLMPFFQLLLIKEENVNHAALKI